MRVSILSCLLGSGLALAGAEAALGQAPVGVNGVGQSPASVPPTTIYRRATPTLDYASAPSRPQSYYAAVPVQQGYAGGASAAGQSAVTAPSLLPLPALSAPNNQPYYGGAQTAATFATEAPYPTPVAAPDTLPEPIPAADGARSPSDAGAGYSPNYAPGYGATPNYGAGSSGPGGNTQLSTSPSTALGGAASGCACADDCLFGGYCGGMWFASVGGLGLGRNNANRFWTTYETNNNPDQLMNTQQAHAGWGGGGEVTLGRWFGGGGGGGGLGGGGLGGGGVGGMGLAGAGFGAGMAGFGQAGGGYGSGGACGSDCQCGCGCPWGIAATYWGVSPMTGSSSLTSPTNTLSTPIDLGYVNITNSLGTSPNPASYFFDNSHQQTLSRVDRINNVEVNFIALSLLGCGRTQAIWLAGVRYFRFDETLTYGASAYGYTMTQNNGAYAAYLRDRSINNLVGPQIGVILSHYITPRFGVFMTPKVGIFGNYASSQNTLYTGDGYTQFDIKADKTEFSMLAQLDLGANYWIKPWWSLYGGFRVIGINQLALADNQFLPFLADTQGFGQPKTNGDVILYGAFGGMVFRF